jgi:hypothetical protein
MPADDDAGWLRSLMNETQMLFHSLGNNEGFNGFWFWGFGDYPSSLEPVFNCAGNSPIVGGLDCNQVEGRDSLYVDEGCLHAMYRNNALLWNDAVAHLDQVIGKLLSQIRKNKGEELFVFTDTGKRIHYTRQMRLRFWRKRCLKAFLSIPSPGKPA